MATLRYSPRNFLVVDFPFDTCSLPPPNPCPEPQDDIPALCKPLPILVAPDTYDWSRFLPEVMVGIEDPDADIAANFVREAAIEFARDAHVLQRDLTIDLEPGEDIYPLFPIDGERIEGIIIMELDAQEICSCTKGTSGETALGFLWRFDQARNLLELEGQPKRGRLNIRVWAVPTEDACVYDRFLYDNFRREITIGARRRYVMALHFRDRALVQTLPSFDAWTYAVLTALKRAHRTPTARKQNPGSGMWHGGSTRTRRAGSRSFR